MSGTTGGGAQGARVSAAPSRFTTPDKEDRPVPDYRFIGKHAGLNKPGPDAAS